MTKISTLFRQSDVDDPYKLYSEMLIHQSVFWDSQNQVWGVYSYADCQKVLSSEATRIPNRLVNPVAKGTLANNVAGSFVRLSNGSSHESIRKVTSELFQKMQIVDIASLLSELLENEVSGIQIDWVSICKKLPVLVILKGFDFMQSDIDFILPKIQSLIRLMSLSEEDQQLMELNSVVSEVYSIAEKQVLRKHWISDPSEELIHLAVSNLLGLMIQSFDASRGLLSNAFLQMVRHRSKGFGDRLTRNEYEQFVVETLRFDPPVHNTRRTMTESIQLKDQEITKGQTVVVVLAAANRDPAQFQNPNEFDICRSNNDDLLTFGFAAHSCVARHFSIRMATETLYYIFETKRDIKLLEQKVEYEPLINVRLPKHIWFTAELPS